jgi:hypothetical protein
MSKPMTSERRSQIIVVSVVLAAICAYGQSVKVWTKQDIFGIVGVAAAALINGMGKSPREAALSDKASGEAEGSTVKTVSTTDTHEVINVPGGKDETNKGPAVVPRAAARE